MRAPQQTGFEYVRAYRQKDFVSESKDRDTVQKDDERKAHVLFPYHLEKQRKGVRSAYVADTSFSVYLRGQKRDDERTFAHAGRRTYIAEQTQSENIESVSNAVFKLYKRALINTDVKIK